MDPRAHALLLDWFGTDRTAPGAPPPPEARTRAWWRKDDAEDARLRDAWGALHAQGADGRLGAWAAHPHGRVALVVLLDQLSRNLHRDTPGMFASDPLALQLTLDALARGEETGLDLWLRLFLLMPLMHSEALEVHHLARPAFEALARDGEAAGYPAFASNLDFLDRHTVIIARFGRYPHRNAILGRASTAEEEAFLREPGSSF